MERVTVKLLQEALTPATRQAYQLSWNRFHSFASALQKSALPATIPTVVKFVAYLYSSGLASSTITSTVSAVSYLHKVNMLPDPTAAFVVRKVLQGASKLRGTSDSRLPITLDILKRLVSSTDYTCSSNYLKIMCRAMYMTAFHAFLRVGEITGTGPNVLQRDHVTISDTHYTLTFYSYKHHKGQPVSIIVSASSTSPCPVFALNQYLCLRGDLPGPLFLYPPNKHLSRELFVSNLQASLAWAGLDTRLYKSHSFRIGAATHAAATGHSDAEIQAMGRWKSGAFQKYIRIPTVHF